jgi:hypothetical protein
MRIKKSTESETGSRIKTGGNSIKPNKPVSLVCYICGKEFGTQSLNIHLKTCETNHLREDKLPTLDTIISKKNHDYEEVCQYNADAEKIIRMLTFILVLIAEENF